MSHYSACFQLMNTATVVAMLFFRNQLCTLRYLPWVQTCRVHNVDFWDCEERDIVEVVTAGVL